MTAAAAHAGSRWLGLDAALAAAGTRDLPVLVLMGSPLDHWQARWQREADRDGELAELLDAVCVCAVADPADTAVRALATRVQLALAFSSQHAGWPVAAVLLGDGRVVGAWPWRAWRDQGRTPGLARALIQLADLWQRNRDAVLADAATMQAQCATLATRATQAAGTFKPGLLCEAGEAALMNIADTMEGGFGPPPRGIAAAVLGFTLCRALRSDAAPSLVQQVRRTFDAWCAGALHDHLGGGFFRACNDSAWHQPSFEKRLADNAQAAALLLGAGQHFAVPLYRAVGLRALEWALHALNHGDGSHAHGLCAESALADGQPGNGAYYSWSQAGMANVIGQAGAALVARRFMADERSQIAPGFYALAVRGQLEPRELDQLPALCARLLVARTERPAPVRNDRVLADEQGMLLCALAAARSADAGNALWTSAGDRLAAWCASAAAACTDANELAWLGRGLLAWGDDRTVATACAERALAAISAAPVSDALSLALDDERGPGPAAVCALLLVELGRRDDALALAARWRGLLTGSAPSVAGLLHALAAAI